MTKLPKGFCRSSQLTSYRLLMAPSFASALEWKTMRLSGDMSEKLEASGPPMLVAVARLHDQNRLSRGLETLADGCADDGSPRLAPLLCERATTSAAVGELAQAGVAFSSTRPAALRFGVHDGRHARRGLSGVLPTSTRSIQDAVCPRAWLAAARVLSRDASHPP